MTSNDILVQLNYNGTPYGRVWAESLSIGHSLQLSPLRKVNGQQSLPSRGKSSKTIAINGLVDRELLFVYLSKPEGFYTQPWQVYAGDDFHDFVFMDNMSVTVTHNGTPRMNLNAKCYEYGYTPMPNDLGTPPTQVEWMKGYEFTIEDSGSLLNNVAEFTYSMNWDWYDREKIAESYGLTDPVLVLEGMTQTLDIVTTGLVTGFFPNNVGKINGDIIIGNTTDPGDNIHFTADNCRIDSQSAAVDDILTTRTTLREIVY